ncbi:MAG: BON domain-containing protein [Candidatus Abyssobacteria bacterium SURF_5]|uniref:BON domain-containing protein n=1 Tax=Abyssobacteria bacterium (strain SURF_5) TaxID=2093360 RepID=A0A3A4NVM2_ABYX5|nr:MAG: BON domain-containing protein [Candidatus Abyssubacteria bacterium SURF_5]
MFACLAVFSGASFAQVGPEVKTPEEKGPAAPREEPSPEVPERVEVKPVTRDHEIRERLNDILEATGWFMDLEVRVEDGVVFLEGGTETDDHKEWAADLARRTQDVTAVVNKIEVVEPSVWDFEPALAGLREQWRDVMRGLPFVAFGLLILAVAWGMARLIAITTRRSLGRRQVAPLLRDVIARGAGLVVLLAGLYVVFRVAGLTTIALTVIGGTGLLGIILGIAFRDITENLLASVFLSIQNPFGDGDLIEIAGVTGYVQRMTIRTTILMTLDGNHVQIPNATVYKSTIRNFSSNPNRREDFTVGIGYDDAIPAAQEVALRVLAEHPAVLKSPEPWVLVDGLGKSTVNLRVYFWLDGSRHSWLKVKSSVIRLVKRAFQSAGISMPDEARELIFPRGVPVRLVEPEAVKKEEAAAPHPEYQIPEEPATVTTGAEGGLRSEEGEIREQARHSRTPEGGENLLKPMDTTRKDRP